MKNDPIVIKSFLSKNQIEILCNHALNDLNGERWWLNRGDDPIMENLANDSIAILKKELGMNLKVEHTAWRCYTDGDELMLHTDPNPPIDVAVSVTVKVHNMSIWPLYINDIPYTEEIGTGLIMTGQPHFRKKLKTNKDAYQIQALMFFTAI